MLGQVHGCSRNIDRCHFRCTAGQGIEGKTTNVGETIEHSFVLNERPQIGMIRFLVEKIAGFLATGQVNGQPQAILQDGFLSLVLTGIDSAVQGQPFFTPDGFFVLQDQSFGLDLCDQRLTDGIEVTFHAQGQDLDHQRAGELVDNQAGQSIGLTKHQTVAVGFQAPKLAPESDGCPDPVCDQVGSDWFMRLGQDPDCDHGLGVVETSTEIAATEIKDGDRITR